MSTLPEETRFITPKEFKAGLAITLGSVKNEIAKFPKTSALGSDDLLVGFESVAEWLRVSTRTVRRHVANGRIPFRRIGKKFYFSKTEIMSVSPTINPTK